MVEYVRVHYIKPDNVSKGCWIIHGPVSYERVIELIDAWARDHLHYTITEIEGLHPELDKLKGEYEPSMWDKIKAGDWKTIALVGVIIVGAILALKYLRR